MSRPSRTPIIESGEGCGSTLLGCALSSCALSFVIIVMLAMIPGVRNLVRKGFVHVTGERIQRVTIPEGWNRYQVASRLANQGIVANVDVFLAATEDRALLEYLEIPADSAEGYLFPDTYDFYRASEPDEIVERMVHNLRAKFKILKKQHPVGLDTLADLATTPEHAAVILASVVEKEAVKSGEQPRIAGVFLNRLTIDEFPSRLLQADPTVAYGCVAIKPPPPSCKDFAGSLRRRHLEDEANSYNTYVHSGLPPGPIANPGQGALEAVLAPEQTDDLYFVARGDGTHEFSQTLKQHRAAVKKYRDGG